MKNYQETNKPDGLIISFIERPFRAEVVQLEHHKAAADLKKGFVWGWLDDELVEVDATKSAWLQLMPIVRRIAQLIWLYIPMALKELSRNPMSIQDRRTKPETFKWPQWVSGYVGMALTPTLPLLALAIITALISAIIAPFDKDSTVLQAFQFLLTAFINAFFMLFHIIALYLMLLIPRYILRIIEINVLGSLVYKRDFKRTITFSIANGGQFKIESEFDELIQKAYGQKYKSQWIDVAEIVSIEAEKASTFAPEIVHLGNESDKTRSVDLTWTFQIRAFDYDGESFLLMYDGAGNDFARRLRLRIEGYFARCLKCGDTLAYLQEMGASTPENKTALLNDFRIVPKRTRRTRRARMASVIPINDRL